MKTTHENYIEHFPYSYKTKELSPMEYLQIVNWCMHNCNGKFTYMFSKGDTFYFKEEKHMLWFIMRWS
jgi:hypothetical protein